MNNVKSIERWTHRGRVEARKCGAAGCMESTREGKPYCPEHVLMNPYVRELLERLAGREAEEQKVLRVGQRAVDPEGITAQEILSYLRVHGQRSLPQLGRELTLDVKLVGSYVRVLESKRWVKTKRDARGMTFALPVESDAAVADPKPFDTPSQGTRIA
ncbi:MAG: hypothetical protein KDD82_07415 [Planctomycetes bacterium]|nr:hypothetical protein [Planctomycetota bacterium]